MYHPEDGYPEFIELMNTGEDPVFLHGFSFTKGISYLFDRDDAVYPGKGIVLTNDTLLFKKLYRFSAYGQFRNNLSNQGETLILRNNLNLVIDSLTYSNTSPWPVIPGDGYSIELKDISSDNTLAGNWKVSEKKHGTPFRPEVSQQWEAVIFPNPVIDFATIRTGEPELAFSKFVIEIFNHAGLLVNSIKTESYNAEIKIDLTGMNVGFYYLGLMPEKSGYGVTILKVIKM